jgi:3-hydroxyacyl-CoA dehydrogenase
MNNSGNEIKTIGIAGEGKMGTSIFYHFLGHGFSMRWLVSKMADVDKLSRQTIRKSARLNSDLSSDKPAISVNPDILSGCDLVIEAIPEDPGLKKALFSQLHEILPQSVILTTNSSSIEPSSLCPSPARASDFCGLHFFYPLNIKPFAEIILTNHTSIKTSHTLESFLTKTGFISLMLQEKQGFILNRILLEVQNEAWHIVHSGRCTIDQLDKLVGDRLFPASIFSMMDHIGIDLLLVSVKNYIAFYPNQSYYLGFVEDLEKMVSLGHTGKKCGKGFYIYPQAALEISLPSESELILEHLKQTWLSACKRYAAVSHLPLTDLNDAIRDYFEMQKGPFEL